MSYNHTTGAASSAEASLIESAAMRMRVDGVLEAAEPALGPIVQKLKRQPNNLDTAIGNIMPMALEIVIQSISEEQRSPFNPTKETVKALKGYIALWFKRKVLLEEMSSDAK
ncbi:hypothetical protein B0H65DRAFT_467173 [Neurospora tetraspora]|uniref:Uncharacterized protein n=1 Tax=Neurospora tetraspora TaxID=94610 RepID=A0AAE0MSG8_9PEZI|nr:hypothetical protein B0H65DRAFT_467173 [Neurospora tetraspora]